MSIVNTVWECWSYDVWGNAQDGYEVNDRSCFERALPLRLYVRTYNAGTPQEFQGAYPSDGQIRKAFGVRCRIVTDGDDTLITIERARDRYPIGEMHCTSHMSLSPVREEKS